MIWMIGYGHPLLDGRIHHREAVLLAEAGMKVGVVARRHPTIPTGPRVDQVEQVELPPLHSSLLIQLFLTPWYWLQTYCAVACRARRGDVFVAHEHQSLSMACLLKFQFRGKAVYDAHEDWPENFSHSVAMLCPWARAPVRCGMKIYESIFCRGMDAITIVSRHMFETGRLPREKSILYPNRPRQDAVPFPLRRHYPSKDLERRLEGKKVLLFLGYVGPRAGSIEMLTMMHEIRKQRDDVILVIAGQIVSWHEEELRGLQTELGLEHHVIFTGNFSPPESSAYLSIADLAINLQRDTPAHYQYAEATKYFLYAAAGLPQVATDIISHRFLKQEGSPAVLTPCDDGTAAAAAVLELLDDEALREAMSEKIRACFLHTWSLEQYTDDFLNLYRKLTQPGALP